MTRRLAFALGVLLTGMGVQCGNQSGNLTASKTGDTSRPAKRSDPLAELRSACGADGATTAPRTVVQRDPYLQQVGTSSVMVGWVTSAASEQRIEVTLPDGSPVASAPAELEQTTRRAAARQVWAHLTGLSADTLYCYTLVGAEGALTERIGFRTAPAADTKRPIRFLAFGDSGGGGVDQVRLLEQMHSVPFEVAVHTGDLAYDKGSLNDIEDTVFGIYGEWLRHVPLFPAAGNHDYDTMQGAPFREVFALPGDSGEKWYSYDWGPIHFVALDTESSYATQAEWLERDLAASPLPWKIIYLHRPPYSSGNKHGSDTGLRKALEPVLVKHGVQLVLSGHDHHYERMHPQLGVMHVLTGGGGVGTRSVGSSAFTAFSEEVIHFVYGELEGDQLVLHAIDGTGKEFDSVVIPRVAPAR